jgi:hypothetical protein
MVGELGGGVYTAVAQDAKKKILSNAMPVLPVEKFIEKIALLERSIGKQVGYRILEPFHIAAGHVVAIQAAARQIAEFVGLQNLTFIVGIVTQDSRTAGHIELKHGEPGVFIEVSPDITNFEAALLATLAHEVTHKYMHVHQIPGGPNLLEIENEFPTDITAVFLGLGKLVLNGSESKVTRTEPTEGGTTTITDSFKCGYLGRDQLALTYLLVCTMRKIPPAGYEAGLTPEAKTALSETYRLHAEYLDGHLHEKVAKEKCQGDLSSAILDCQVILAGIERNLLYLRGAYEKELESFLEQVHNRLKGLQAEAARILDETEIDPCLKFLSAVQQTQRVRSLVQEIGECSRKGEAHNTTTSNLASVVQTFGNPSPVAASALFGVATCKVDGTKLRVPVEKGLVRVRCPGCKYEFQVNTSVPTAPSPTSETSKSVWQRLSGLWRTS